MILSPWRLASLVGLAVQVLIAAEGLVEAVEVAAVAVVRALDCLRAGKPHPLTRQSARVAVVAAAVAIDIDAARAVAPRARRVVAAAASVLHR